MAKVNLSQAAKLTGKNRTTIWRHINGGKLSSERDRDGLPFVDTSELIRVYGELIPIATPLQEEKPHQATPSYGELVRVVELLRKEQSEMKEQLIDLKNRLSYTPTNAEIEKAKFNTPPPEEKGKPENDLSWPVEIKSLTDIVLRDEIRKKYL